MPEASIIQNSVDEAFQRERFKRTIEQTSSVEDLRKLAIGFLGMYFGQKAAARWAFLQSMSKSNIEDFIQSSRAHETSHQESVERQYDSDQSSWEEDLTG